MSEFSIISDIKNTNNQAEYETGYIEEVGHEIQNHRNDNFIIDNAPYTGMVICIWESTRTLFSTEH